MFLINFWVGVSVLGSVCEGIASAQGDEVLQVKDIINMQASLSEQQRGMSSFEAKPRKS